MWCDFEGWAFNSIIHCVVSLSSLEIALSAREERAPRKGSFHHEQQG